MNFPQKANIYWISNYYYYYHHNTLWEGIFICGLFILHFKDFSIERVFEFDLRRNLSGQNHVSMESYFHRNTMFYKINLWAIVIGSHVEKLTRKWRNISIWILEKRISIVL